MTNEKENGHDIILSWSFVIILVEMVLIWTIASGYNYLLFAGHSQDEVFGYLVVILLISGLTAFSVGTAGARGSERWGKQRCRYLFGAKPKLMYKSELFVLVSILIGTVVGVGSWDLVTVFTAFASNGWKYDTFFREYIVIDLIFTQIWWQLWLHLLSAIVGLSLGISFAVMIATDVRKGNFCDIK